MTRAMQRAAALCAAVTLLVGGCATTEPVSAPEPVAGAQDASPTAAEADGAQDDRPAPPAPARMAAGRSLIATSVVSQIEVFDDPGGAGTALEVLDHPTARGAPRVFLVEDRQGDWLEVLLPVRPNGSTGWIRADDVELTQTGYAVEVDLADYELRVVRDGEEVVTTPIAYGAEDTPTPGGRFYLTELLQPPDPDGVYGSFAFGLSGFSDVLYSFAGGEGVIGIHGTNDPDSIGRQVSAGCIRVPDDVIVELAGMLPLGTPVTITG